MVLAIQAPMSNDSRNRFISTFYAELWRTGSVDVATSLARGQIVVPESWDWVAPVVYTRTVEAQLFLPPPPDLIEFDARWLKK